MSNFPSSSNGGCSILSFNVLMDDGLLGSYISKVGESSPYLMTTYGASSLVKGRTYRFKYRVKNCHGWGPFSNDFFAQASELPSKPPAPTLISVSATAI
jgi:hypothetical protein